jgi:S1-C subfamily serine protease
MITKKVIADVRNGVCAVGYLSVPLEEYRKNPESPLFQVLGTGFLVRPTTVITNRHVIEGLFDSQANLGFPSTQFFLSFVVPDKNGSLRHTVRMIRHFTSLTDLDIGFVEFKIVHDAHFEDIHPLQMAESADLKITEEIAVCGFPYGTAMLKRRARIYRWGPVIQQGSISAISPFDGIVSPDEILLDVRTAPGMSGAPIFRPENGEVIGIHYAGWEATTALGLPLTQSQVLDWLSKFDEQMQLDSSDDEVA